jgi:maltooligosyltrehalose trehalohydrolase
VINDDCFIVRYYGVDDGDDRLLVINFGSDLKFPTMPQPLLAPPPDRTWKVVWNSDLPCYGGRGECPLETDQGWFFPGESAYVLRAVTDHHETNQTNAPTSSL